ncbi:MAG: Ku protein [Bacilli bacterium]|nr:Ku protein [Bacilli bacterium]
MPNIHSSISFGLVNIPIIMNPLIKNNDTSFNQLHKKCLNRIQYLKYCPSCKEKLKENDIIKGYEIEKDEYLTFTKEELNKLKPEKTNEIEIVGFINLKDVDPIYFEKSYILLTEKKTKAYSLFIKALKEANKVALGKTILGSKFYYCILRLNKEQIVMTTLYFEEEIKQFDAIKMSDINQKELDTAMMLIKQMEIKFEPEKYQDEYQKSIKDAINNKLNGEKINPTKKKKKTEINNLLLALEKSLKK